MTAPPRLVGLPAVSLANPLDGNGPGLTLPTDVVISTPTGLLGSDCTVGDASDPVTLNLTTGTTNPPSPNKRISWPGYDIEHVPGLDHSQRYDAGLIRSARS